MKVKIKISIIIVLIIGVIFLIKSRIVYKENYDLMVLLETNQVLEVCLKKKEAELNGKIFEIPENEKIYFSKYGNDLCENQNQLKKNIEKSIKESLQANWLFVF